MNVSPRTRYEDARSVTEVDPDTGKTYVTGRTRTGRLIDKNRSDGWRGYKSHLTERQRKLMRWALRQRDRGVSRERVWIRLQELGWEPSPMQYPLTQATIGSWELTRASQKARGREWP